MPSDSRWSQWIHNNQAGLRLEMASYGRSNTHNLFPSSHKNRAEGEARLKPSALLAWSRGLLLNLQPSKLSQNPMSRVGPGPSEVNASPAFCVLRTSSGAAIEVAQLVTRSSGHSASVVTKHVDITSLSEPQRACTAQHAARRVNDRFILPAVR